MNPSTRSDEAIQSMIPGSVVEIRTRPLCDPSASKMPARNPLHHSGRGLRGQRINSRIAATLSLA